MIDDIWVILDEQDAADLLRVLYNGKPHHVHTLICLCGTTADLRKSPKAWNGWQILPHAKCPTCQHLPAISAVQLDPVQARERFELELMTIRGEEIAK